jgi:hypothetical protein
MDSPLTPEKQNAAIEDALRTYPILPLPRDLTAEIIGRLHTVPAPRPFPFTWNDLVLGIVLFLCVGAFWFSLNSLPPLVAAQIRRDTILLYQQIIVSARGLLPVLLFGLAGLLAALTIPYLSQELRK